MACGEVQIQLRRRPYDMGQVSIVLFYVFLQSCFHGSCTA